ncbi:Fic family protein [Patescibacteria group bacterium]|nr:Fic family protein [Patescibacteria group bacterium]
MTVAEKLKIIQNISGLTQEKIAKKLGVSFVSFNSWINGKSEPRRKAKKNIDSLYSVQAGQKIIIEDPLKAKKEIIKHKARKYKNVLKEILKNPDICDQFLLALTYNTNRLEGSTLTEDDTKAILFDNVALSNKTITEQLEAKNHQTALNYLFNYISLSSSRINETLILKLHSILMNGIRDDAGSWRRHGVRIVGTNVPTANYLKIPQLIDKLIKDINYRNKDAIFHVSNIHSCFEKIHPFSDGNGRIGRLILIAMLLKCNLPPAIIKQRKKRSYNSALRKSQLQENFIPLENFICDSVIAGFLVLERK